MKLTDDAGWLTPFTGLIYGAVCLMLLIPAIGGAILVQRASNAKIEKATREFEAIANLPPK